MALKDILAQIETKEKQHDALKAKDFNSLNFDDKLTFFQLKAELGQLYSKALGLADNLKDKGLYIRKVVYYNPFLKTNMVNGIETRINGGLGYHYLRTAGSDNKERAAKTITTTVAIGPGVVIGVVTGAVSVFSPFFYGVPKSLTGDWLNERFHMYFANAACEELIPAETSSEDCLSIAVAHLESGKNYLAIRYLLEADIRSKTPNPEICHYLSKCFEDLREVLSQSLAETEIPFDLKHMLNGLFRIKETIPQSQKPKHVQLNGIWEMKNDSLHDKDGIYRTSNQASNFNQDFKLNVHGEQKSENAYYEVTLVELIKTTRTAIHKNKEINSIAPKHTLCVTGEILLKGNGKLKDIHVVELAAYMLAGFGKDAVPEDFINAVITAYPISELEQEYDTNQIAALNYLTSVQKSSAGFFPGSLLSWNSGDKKTSASSFSVNGEVSNSNNGLFNP